MTAIDTHRAIEAVWRIESARVIAGLTRVVRDVGVAEEFAQDAFVAALEQWPESGIPQNPGAWLMATAKHRAIDFLRRGTLIDRKHEILGRELAEREGEVLDFAAAMGDHIGDDLLRLNSLRELPYMKSWAAKYKDAGLVVIGVHAPEFGFEKERANVENAVRFEGCVPSRHRQQSQDLGQAFNNEYWPADYFIPWERTNSLSPFRGARIWRIRACHPGTSEGNRSRWAE